MRSTASVRESRSTTDDSSAFKSVSELKFAAELNQRAPVVIHRAIEETDRRDPESTCVPDQTAAP